MQINLSEITTVQRQQYLQHAIAPRPIAFASTIDSEGNVNLSPFSFFNLFSSDPAIVIFSPSRRVRDNTVKHSLLNVQEVPEVVINIVDEDMVQQTSLASCEYEKGVNEFLKAGFTQEPATLVKPPMVKESKIKLECKVIEVKPLGTKGGAGNLVICEVLCMHIDDTILDNKGMIDQRKIHHVARLGSNWYARITPENLFEVEKPNTKLGIGVDKLPTFIKEHKILTGNHLGQLANVDILPTAEASFSDEKLSKLNGSIGEEKTKKIAEHAAELLNEGKVNEAWQALLLLTKQ
jgi:flavin reductase (DIM6/NTAB) family NADH-FMN oxidoreductase RutF